MSLKNILRWVHFLPSIAFFLKRDGMFRFEHKGEKAQSERVLVESILFF